MSRFSNYFLVLWKWVFVWNSLQRSDGTWQAFPSISQLQNLSSDFYFLAAWLCRLQKLKNREGATWNFERSLLSLGQKCIKSEAAFGWGLCELQWNSVITYTQGKWKKVRINQSTFYPKRDFAHWNDRFHVFTRTICHGRCFSVLNVVHYALFVRWNRLSGHRELENVPGSWNQN